MPGSALPEELRDSGYDVVEIGQGERILPAAIIERFVLGADGDLEPMTAASTPPVTSIVYHAGIARVLRYCFRLP